MSNDDPTPQAQIDNPDARQASSDVERGPKIATGLRFAGGTVFTVLLIALLGYPTWVVATSHWVDFGALGIRCLVLIALLATIGYTGLTLSLNQHWLPAKERTEGRKFGLFLFGFALAIQLLPCLPLGAGFLMESVAMASLGIVGLVVTGVIGLFAIALGFCAAVTGFPPSDRTMDGLVRSIRNAPTDSQPYGKS